MPPKKKNKTQANKDQVPNDVQWCLDKGEDLTFKEYIENWDCLDRNQAQQQFGRILSEHYKSKSALHNKIRTEYKTWTSSADYVRFWKDRVDSMILLKANLGSSELLSEVTDQSIESLKSYAVNTSSQTAASLPSESSKSDDVTEPSSSNDPTLTTIPIFPTVSVTSCGPNEPISVTNLTLHEIHYHLTNIRKNFINKKKLIMNHTCLKISISVVCLANIKMPSAILSKDTNVFLLKLTCIN